jgi:ABC-type branched-subunit amino acid transport system ATPase component
LAHVDKRLVELARALALAPRFLVLDEPAAGLGEEDTARLADLLRRIAEVGVGVVLVEHDMDLVMAVSAHIVVLDAGRKIAEGGPDDIKHDPLVRAAYLGDGHGVERRRAGPLVVGPALLSIDRLAAGYGSIGVLEGLSLEVRQGEMVAVLGANGAGKTTLMRALTGLVRPTAGHIVFDGADMTSRPSSAIAASGLVLVPEGRQVFPELSVVDNLRLGAFARPTADREARIEELLHRFPRLAERRGQRAGLLSGGEQQMLAIARGLMARPRLLLLDEPSLGLAPLLVEQLYDTLAEIRDEGQTILLVDQMAVLALSVVDRAYVLGAGRIVAQGTAAEIAGNAELARAYLGVQELTVG